MPNVQSHPPLYISFARNFMFVSLTGGIHTENDEHHLNSKASKIKSLNCQFDLNLQPY